MNENKKPVVAIIAISLMAVVIGGFILTSNKKSNVIKTDKMLVKPQSDQIAQDTTDLEQSISNALLSYYANNNNTSYEVAGEGHITLDSEEKDGLINAYVYEQYLQFGFEDKALVVIAGHGVNVAKLVFEKDSNGNYIFKELDAPLVDSENEEFINNSFSAEASNKVKSSNIDEIRELVDAQCIDYGKAYLDEIDRKAEVIIYQDEKPTANINAKIANQLLDTYSEYPYWIGNREAVENGTRYIYEQSWEDMGNQKGVVTFTKSSYDGKVVAKIVIEVDGDQMKIIETTNEGIDTQAAYDINMSTFTDKGVVVQYPQLVNFSDSEAQEKINKILEENVLGNYKEFANTAEIQAYEMQYDVMYSSPDFLSIRFNGYNNYMNAAYPSQIMFTLNINLKNQDIVKLCDLVMINEDFVDLFKQGKYIGPLTEQTSELKEAIENQLNQWEINVWMEYLNNADIMDVKNEGMIYSYVTKDSLIISIGVPHVLGDYAELSINYNDLSSYKNEDNEIWKELP